MNTATDLDPTAATAIATQPATTEPTLFDPVRIGPWTLPNRFIMSLVTPAPAGVERIPNALIVEYYRQRVSAGVIFSDATSITPMGVGYADTPTDADGDMLTYKWRQYARFDLF